MSRYIFLNVDGVLNAFDSDYSSRSFSHHESSPGIFPIPLWLRSSDGSRLTAYGAQIVWVTTWVRFPAELEQRAERVGLPQDLPRISHVTDWPSKIATCGKLEGVQQFLASQDHPECIAWIDDALDMADWDFLHSLAEEYGTRFLALAPDPKYGLEDKHFQALDKLFLSD